MTDGSRHVAMH
jgi:hypothetical protein